MHHAAPQLEFEADSSSRTRSVPPEDLPRERGYVHRLPSHLLLMWLWKPMPLTPFGGQISFFFFWLPNMM